MRPQQSLPDGQYLYVGSSAHTDHRKRLGRRPKWLRGPLCTLRAQVALTEQ